MTPATSIHSRALLCWLTISTWSARRYDRKVSAEVNQKYSASDDAGRYNKCLLPGDAPAYKALMTLTSAIRAEHYVHTLAWSDEGWRLLPTANYSTYTAWLRKRQSEFNAALSDFVYAYPILRDQARIRLNGLYRDDDYPSTQDIGKRFSIGVSYQPLPDFGDVRVDLSADQVADIEASISSKISSAVDVAVRDAWQRLYTVVAKISERLGTPDAIFRDSLVENAREVCTVLGRLNVTGDVDLEAMRQRVESQLTQYTPESLRDNAILRESVAAQADQIMAAMSGLGYGVAA